MIVGALAGFLLSVVKQFNVYSEKATSLEKLHLS